MSVVIRLSRQGSKKRPFYRIVAADKRCPRDGKFIELLGTYDPRTKVLHLDGERFERWVKVGALPSGTLNSLVNRQKRTAPPAVVA